jgi:hypothetical protein
MDSSRLFTLTVGALTLVEPGPRSPAPAPSLPLSGR